MSGHGGALVLYSATRRSSLEEDGDREGKEREKRETRTHERKGAGCTSVVRGWRAGQAHARCAGTCLSESESGSQCHKVKSKEPKRKTLQLNFQWLLTTFQYI